MYVLIITGIGNRELPQNLGPVIQKTKKSLILGNYVTRDAN